MRWIPIKKFDKNISPINKFFIAIEYEKEGFVFYSIHTARFERGIWVKEGTRLTKLSKQVKYFAEIKYPHHD